MNFVSTNIYSSSNLQIDYLKNFMPNGAVVVTFTERGNRDLLGPGFGTSFLIKNGFDVIAVKTNIDIWYENLSPQILEIILECIQSSAKKIERTFAYGSSMGAFAAIRFSKVLKIDCVLAISPIFDINDPIESRWKDDSVNLKISPMMDINFISSKTKFCIIADCKSQDIYHLHQYQKIIHYDNISVLNLSYSGHPSGSYLRDIGALSDVVLNAFQNYCVPPYLNKFKSSKMKSDQYLFCLSVACLKHNKIRWAESLIGTLLARSPLNAEYHMLNARIYEKRGNLDKAIAASSRAAILNSHNIHFSRYRDMLTENQIKYLKK